MFPAYNEEPNVGPLIEEALEETAKLVDSFEIVIVDDGSSDGTAAVVRSYAEKHPEVRLVSHPQNLGYGHALRTGLASGKGDIVAWIDGDRQFRIADLKLYLDRIDEAPVVIGYRISRADPIHRRFIANIYHQTLRYFFKLDVHDVDCGFKVFRREVLEDVVPKLESRSAAISPELLLRIDRAGYRMIEVPVPHHPRIAGANTGASAKIIARTIRELIRLRRSLPPPASD